MTVVCAWCQKHLGEKYPEQPGVSHGICEDCAKKVKEERVSNRQTEEHCPCGHRLRTAMEQDTGLCLACQQRGELPAGESFEWERELKREERLLHESQRRRA